MDPHYIQNCILCKSGPRKSYFAEVAVASREKTTRKLKKQTISACSTTDAASGAKLTGPVMLPGPSLVTRAAPEEGNAEWCSGDDHGREGRGKLKRWKAEKGKEESWQAAVGSGQFSARGQEIVAMIFDRASPHCVAWGNALRSV